MTGIRLGAGSTLLFASAWIGAPALAHHSMAMFDRTQKVEIEGIIADVEWTNPPCLG